MTCRMLSTPGFTLFLCDEPYIGGQRWIERMAAQAELEWLEHEQELDLQREAELDPPTEMAEPEVVPAEVVCQWDAYGG